MIQAQVIVRPRASILDPQGEAVKRAALSQGLVGLSQVHVGKCIELKVEGVSLETARPQLESICRDLLSNPVIEEYELKITGLEKENAIPTNRKSAKTPMRPVRKNQPKKARSTALRSVASAQPSMIKKTTKAPAKPKSTPSKAAKPAVSAKAKTAKPAKAAAKAPVKKAAPAKKVAAKPVAKKPVAKKVAPKAKKKA